jgi:hypothetical protein
VVPLRDGGYSVGVVARSDNRGRALGYFLGPRLQSVPTLPPEVELASSDAVRVSIFGDLELLRGKWKVVSRVAGWDPARWPVPAFCRNGHMLVRYDDSLAVVSEEMASHDECASYPEDGLAGAGYVEITLTRELGGRP